MNSNKLLTTSTSSIGFEHETIPSSKTHSLCNRPICIGEKYNHNISRSHDHVWNWDVSEEQELFEDRYNFRFENSSRNSLLTHPRKIDLVVRKNETARRRQRAIFNRQSAQNIDIKLRRNLKHSKLFKSKEITSKINKVSEHLDTTTKDRIIKQILSGNFDLENYVQKLNKKSTNYYINTPSKWPSMQRSECKHVFSDSQDDTKDILTKLRYIQVPPVSFGLNVEDILTTSDKELNQLVSLKKLAPFK